MMCSVGRPTRSIIVGICCREIYAKNQTYQLYFVYSLQIWTNVKNIFNDCLPFTYRIRQQINVFFLPSHSSIHMQIQRWRKGGYVGFSDSISKTILYK